MADGLSFSSFRTFGALPQMKRLVFVFALLCLPRVFALQVDETPRKHNMVSRYLNKILESVLEEVSNKNLSMGMELVELGDDVGRFTDLKGNIFGMTKAVDGIRTWGFMLDAVVNASVGGKYDLLYLDVPKLFPVFGKGRFSILLEGVALGVNLEASFDHSKDEFDIELPRLEISVQKAKVRFENLMNDPFVADFLNELISNLVPDLVAMLSPVVLNEMKPLIAKYTNGIILCIKNELLNNKVEECIENLFKSPTEIEEFFDTMRTALTSELKLAPF